MPLAADSPFNAEALNAALEEYVMTVPSLERLRAHLAAQGLGAEDAARFETELRAAVRATDDFLYGESGKSKWDMAFNERFFQAVAQQHPWISREAFKSLSMYGQYINWHDGLEL